MKRKEDIFILKIKADGYNALNNYSVDKHDEIMLLINEKIEKINNIKSYKCNVEINKKYAACFKMFLDLLGIEYSAHECYNNIYFEFYDITEKCYNYINTYLDNIPEV